jgi:Polysaccharide pyruvyl transferase
MRAMRVLLTGWFSFLHGEATAGDVLAAQAVTSAFDAAGIGHDTAWSPVFRPGALTLEQASPELYTHLVFVCGPLHGEQVAALHTAYPRCRRIAVGVSVVDERDPACRGFDVLLPRDAPGRKAITDLAAAVPPGPAATPVAGIFLAHGQGEYGGRRRHDQVTADLETWLSTRDCAPLALDTRLDSADWRLCSTPAALSTLIARLDIVVTTRLHGLVLGLRAKIPVIAVDPVAGGGKVTAQATAWDWPAVVGAERAGERDLLALWWDWCLSPAGRRRAAAAAASGAAQPRQLLAALVSAICDGRPPDSREPA